MTRILMIFTADDWEQAATCVQSAQMTASEPEHLTFGIALHEPPTDEDLADMQATGAALLYVNGPDAWADLELLWQGESHVLAAHPAMRFSRGWDRALLRGLAWCAHGSGHRTLLTGFLPGSAEPVDAVCAVAADELDEAMRLSFKRGTPLRYARHPVPGVFLNPAFCFAPAVFFRTVLQEDEPLFLAACRHRWEVFTFNRPVIHMQWDAVLMPDDLAPHLEGEAVLRFETRYRVHFADRKLTPRLQCGVMTHDLSFETRVPTMVRMQEALRRIDSHTSRLDPLCVTAWLTLPGQKLDEQRMLCFRRLSSLQALPLLCYTDPPNASRISLSYDHVREYHRHYGLDVPDAVMRRDLTAYMKLCKPFLLARTRQNELRYSHYIWIDFDYLRYPAYEKASLDWQTICHDRIVIAMADGRPDPSMFTVPEELLEPLCREISALIRHRLSLEKPLPAERDLWSDMMVRCPDWFEPVTLPNRRELFALTMTGRGEEFHTH